MFAGLSVEPLRVRTALDEPLYIPEAWLERPPPSAEAFRLDLSPGVWILREPRWHPVSVLDTGALIPPVDVDPVRRVFPLVADWHPLAACLGSGEADALFFGMDDEANPALSPRAIEAARAVCSGCPVASECLTWALEAKNQLQDGFITTGEDFGIWAGTTGRQRKLWRQWIRAGESVEALVKQWLAR